MMWTVAFERLGWPQGNKEGAKVEAHQGVARCARGTLLEFNNLNGIRQRSPEAAARPLEPVWG